MSWRPAGKKVKVDSNQQLRREDAARATHARSGDGMVAETKQ
jgi:hypothetical protein